MVSREKNMAFLSAISVSSIKRAPQQPISLTHHQYPSLFTPHRKRVLTKFIWATQIMGNHHSNQRSSRSVNGIRAQDGSSQQMDESANTDQEGSTIENGYAVDKEVGSSNSSAQQHLEGDTSSKETSQVDSGDNNGSGDHGASHGDSHGDESNENNDEIDNAVYSSDHTRESHSLGVWKTITTISGTVGTGVKKTREYLFSQIRTIFTTVPAPIVVTLISTFSTIAGTRLKNRRDIRISQENRIAAAEKRKTEIETQLRKSYNELAAPILTSSAKLADRLYWLFNCDWSEATASADSNESAKYTAYLIGRYFCTVEIIKRESSLLDYGFPTADRIAANILGRIQGVFGATDSTLKAMQENERYFKPAPGEKPLEAGLLHIVPQAQVTLGELLLRKKWKPEYGFIDKDGAMKTTGPAATVSFYEFRRLLESEPNMQEWFQPLVDDCKKLETHLRENPVGQRRNNGIGARTYFIQAGMLDLVEFFDPLPYGKRIPNSRRRRLQLGGLGHNEEQRAPMSLHKIYHELADIRDHRVENGQRTQRLRLPHGVEVYVTGSLNLAQNGEYKLAYGDCPFSHRVLMVLHEMGIPHKVVPIATNNKPHWFYLLQPQNTTPVIYHDGTVIDDSGQIVEYLLRNYPTAKQMASTENVKVTVGTQALTKFHNHFREWIRGDEAAKGKVLQELKSLDGFIAKAQFLNEGKPFLGGVFFSREDTAIAPVLHNVSIVGKDLMNWDIPAEFTALRKYINAARLVPSFASTVGDDDAIVQGYKRSIGKKQQPILLRDMLD